MFFTRRLYRVQWECLCRTFSYVSLYFSVTQRAQKQEERVTYMGRKMCMCYDLEESLGCGIYMVENFSDRRHVASRVKITY